LFSSCVVNFAQISSQPSGTSAGGTSQLNPSAQPMNHSYNRTTIDGSTLANVMSEMEIPAEQNDSSNDVQSSDCISVPSENRSASILRPYPTTNSKVESQGSDDMHNPKTSAADDHQEDSASNGLNEETSHPDPSIDITEQQASSLVSANKIDGQVFNDVKETDIAIKKGIFIISDEPSRCVTEWVNAKSAPFVCPVLYPVAQNIR
jgi:hypothetical protein